MSLLELLWGKRSPSGIFSRLDNVCGVKTIDRKLSYWKRMEGECWIRFQYSLREKAQVLVERRGTVWQWRAYISKSIPFCLGNVRIRLDTDPIRKVRCCSEKRKKRRKENYCRVLMWYAWRYLESELNKFKRNVCGDLGLFTVFVLWGSYIWRIIEKKREREKLLCIFFVRVQNKPSKLF